MSDAEIRCPECGHEWESDTLAGEDFWDALWHMEACPQCGANVEVCLDGDTDGGFYHVFETVKDER